MAGVIGCAVADEVVLAHPRHVEGLGLALVLGGPILYLSGTSIFKWITNDRRAPPLSHLIGLALLGVLAWPAATHAVSPLTLYLLANGALLIVALWESLALRKGVVPEKTVLDDETA